MKRLGQYVSIIILLGFIGASGFFIYQKTLSPCDKPLEYAIGRFDTQFGLSREEFRIYIAEAGSTWEKALGKIIFLYDPDAEFKINLIYDERQLATMQKQKTEFGLSAVEDALKKLDVEFSIFKNQYDQKVSIYERASDLYEKRKEAYDKDVSFWNNRGGAPKAEYESLEAERRYLNAEAQRLNAEALSINAMTNQLNNLLKTRNTKASEYNKIAEEYNKKYNGGLEFNQAEYTGKEINVYQFGNKRDLILALAHELGHALGMEHVDDPSSIMYYLTGGNTGVSLTPSSQDLAELKFVCKIK